MTEHPSSGSRPYDAGQPGPGGPGNPGPGAPGSGAPGPGSQDAYGNPIPPDARTMATLSHLSTPLIMLITAGWLSFLGPLIFWLIYKDKPGYAFVRESSAEAFNFNVIVWIINIVGWIVAFATLGVGLVIAVPLWLIVGLIAIILHVIAAVRAHNGEIYRYPFKIRVLS